MIAVAAAKAVQGLLAPAGGPFVMQRIGSESGYHWERSEKAGL